MGMKPGSVEWAIEELKTTDWKWMSDQMERQYRRWHKNISAWNTCYGKEFNNGRTVINV